MQAGVHPFLFPPHLLLTFCWKREDMLLSALMMVLIIKSCRVHTNRLWLWCWPQGTIFCWHRYDTLIFSQITEWSIPSASKCRHNDFNVHLWPWWWNYIESGLRKTTIFIHLSLCAVLIAHVGGGVLVDAVVGQVGEHISHLGALIAVLVGCKPKFQNWVKALKHLLWVHLTRPSS